jgi:hypothetical protein
MTETAQSLAAHRVAIVVLSLLYAPFYIADYILTAAVNLGGGGVSMDGILFVSAVAAVVGVATCLLGFAMTRAHRWQSVLAAWLLWMAGATLAPVGALAVWESFPLVLWSPPVVVGVVCVIAVTRLRD